MHKSIVCDHSLGHAEVHHQKVDLSRTDKRVLLPWQAAFKASLTGTCLLTAPAIVYDPVYVVVSDTTEGSRHSFLVTHVHIFLRPMLLFEWSLRNLFQLCWLTFRKARGIRLCEQSAFRSSADRGAWQILSGSPPRVFASTTSGKTPIEPQTLNPNKPSTLSPDTLHTYTNTQIHTYPHTHIPQTPSPDTLHTYK